MRYADVIVDIASEKLDRPFSYAVPEELDRAAEPGAVVQVPFGNGSREIEGYITGLHNQPPKDLDPARIKQINAVVTDGPGEEARLVKLAVWMKDHYGCTMIQALKTVIPVRRKIKPKERRYLILRKDPQEAGADLERYERKHQTARARLLKALLEEPMIWLDLAQEKLHISMPVIRYLEREGILEVCSETVYRNPLEGLHTEKSFLTLNPEQKRVVDRIIQEWNTGGESEGRYLLHGITGSGKTLVYMELIDWTIRQGKQAIVLIPEIALTWQTVMRFYRRFGDRVSVIHSRMSAGERYDQFARAREGRLDVMIGPRSALFTPFPHLGMIVIDEEQEPAYESEKMPRYHARETAAQRAALEGAKLILGSATPSVNAYYLAKKGVYTLLEMHERAGSAVLPSVEVVDLRRELQEGNRSVLSRRMQEEIENRLQRGEQTMLFLNRRGYAGFISCRECGEVLICPHCDVALSLHNDGLMHCHYCGFTSPVRSVCPTCGSVHLRSFRVGTQQIEEEVKQLFPGAGVLRMDADTTSRKGGHEAVLSAFASHEADILVGTQMIVKGHDFPDVTLVGILAADLSLHVPDYHASERTFQLLTQAAGRAGRADRPGSVIIQTYSPQHYSVRSAAAQDYALFYREEMRFRTAAGYPPAGSLTGLHLSCTNADQLEKACYYLHKFAGRLAERYSLTLIGPADESISKIADHYRKALYLRHERPETVEAVRQKIQEYIEINEGFREIEITIQVE